MSRRLGRFSAGAATTGLIIGAVAVLTAGTAAATTNYQTGTVSYTCNFPSIGTQQLDITAAFDGPDSAPAGSAVTPSNITGTATISAAIHALLNAANYDGVRGKATVPVTADNLAPAAATVTNLDVPTQIFSPYVPGPLTIKIAQDAGTGVPGFTAGSAGSATVSLDTPITAPLEFHKKSGTWASWSFTCNVKPSQTKTFSPSLPIT